jgi:hypothetical protein
MRFPGGKYPGHHVVREVRKGQGSQRLVVFHSGKIKKLDKKEIAAIARDRGYDLSNYRFRTATPEVRRQMLRGSLEWQRKAKGRWVKKLKDKLKTIADPQKRRRYQSQIAGLRGVRPRSPHTGDKPVSGYLKRYWS